MVISASVFLFTVKHLLVVSSFFFFFFLLPRRFSGLVLAARFPTTGADMASINEAQIQVIGQTNQTMEVA